jgi:hypothetical protein
VHGGTEVVPLLREGLLEAEQLVDVRGVVPRGVQDGTIGAGTTLAELEVEPAIPDALREACRLAASPQLRNMSSLGGNLSRRRAAGTGGWAIRAACTAATGCHARDGEHREHAIFANGFCASAHPSDVAAALVALGARLRTNRRELAVEELYRLPDEADRSTTTLEDGELCWRSSCRRWRRASTSRRWTASAVVPAGGSLCGSARRRLDADRARRRRAGPVATWRNRRPRLGHAAAADGVEGAASRGARPRALAALARASDRPDCPACPLFAIVARGGRASSRYGTEPPKQVALLPQVLAALRESSVDAIVVVSGAHALPVRASSAPTGSAGPAPRCAAGSPPCRSKPRPRSSSLADGPTSTRARRPRDRGLAHERRRRGGRELRRRPPPPRPARAARSGTTSRRGREVAPARLVPCDDLTPHGDVDFSPAQS